MNSSKSIKIILTILVVALVVFIGFKYISGSSDIPAGSEVLGVTTAGGSPVGAQIITELKVLDSIKLDPELFTDSVFLSLKDYSLQVVPEKEGRANPFAPYGSGGTFQGTTTRSIR